MQVPIEPDGACAAPIERARCAAICVIASRADPGRNH
jgi:hypothetical protein